MALLIHRTNHFKSCLLYAPRGSVLRNDSPDILDQLLTEAKKIAKEQHAYLLRMDPATPCSNQKMIDFYRNRGFKIDQDTSMSLSFPRLSYEKDLRQFQTQSNPEATLLNSYSKSRRRDVRIAQKRNITVRIGSAEDIRFFYLCMKSSSEKNRFAMHPMEYYRQFLTTITGAALFIAEDEERIPIAAGLAVVADHRMWHVHGGADYRYSKGKASSLLQF